MTYEKVQWQILVTMLTATAAVTIFPFRVLTVMIDPEFIYCVFNHLFSANPMRRRLRGGCRQVHLRVSWGWRKDDIGTIRVGSLSQWALGDRLVSLELGCWLQSSCWCSIDLMRRISSPLFASANRPATSCCEPNIDTLLCCSDEPSLIPLRTPTSFLYSPTEIAELRFAPTRHVIAPHVELDHRRTSWTP
jgi:hypothetical protein